MSPALAGNVRQERAQGPHRVLKGPMAMSGSEVASLVRHLKPNLLEGLTQPDLQYILAGATPRRFLANSVIVNQGDPAERLFLLLKGHARNFFMTPDGQKIILTWLMPGEMFNVAALLPKRSHYLISTEAVRNSCVLVWDRTTVRSLYRRYPQLMENTLSILWDRFNAYLISHLSLTRLTARQRLSHVVVHLASGIGRKVLGGVEILVSNEDLANIANVTPFTASRLLSEWQRKGLLAKSRGKVLLRDPERLVLHDV
jgi:CRP/FNR family transcriptional regulator, nitrogen oxide reductase regulator